MDRHELKTFIEMDAEEIEIYDIIQACAKRLGWDIAVEEGHEIVRGLVIGTTAYMNDHIPKENQID